MRRLFRIVGLTIVMYVFVSWASFARLHTAYPLPEWFVNHVWRPLSFWR